MKIKKLIKVLGLKNNQIRLLNDFEVKGVSCNSKQVGDSFIFVAINGAQADGRKFIEEAIKRGAKLIISQAVDRRPQTTDRRPQTTDRRPQTTDRRPQTVDHRPQTVDRRPQTVDFIVVKDARVALGKLAAQFYGNPAEKIKVVGVTGTNGKTTITYLIEAILKKARLSPAVIGTINHRFKNKVFASKNTTPGPLDIQSMFAQMLECKVTHCAVEVSSHALDQDRVQAIDFNSAIFTNLTQDHLDYHKTINNYFKSKLKLFSNLNKKSFAILNIDDKYGRRIIKNTKAKIITYSIDSDADFKAEDIRSSCLGLEFSLKSKHRKINIKSSLIGRHNVYNILAAVSWARAQKISLGLIKSAILNFRNVPGRLEKVGSGKLSIFVDYAHTEDALKNVLKSLRPLTKNKIIVVFGCGGDRDKLKRPKMGKIVTELADYAIITNDNPRSEEPMEIIKDIKAGIRRNNYCVIPKRDDAIRKSLNLASSGDVVLVAGKGHETYQILKNETIHFDDRKVIKQCLKSLKF
ncbi:MAG: UDP-N-acetylmuramoyl-L-alanyl-D-glutamate--2,6-diaminopimelate ligase [Candidatus Omnitrophota bacterium]